ncbi:MAG: carbohydrate ABC transporter substrate-binding protein [Alphaproteobacteria bacterium]|nr:carbohydrate ABC transporter substrate-binding protein [Alphaproteobacteria bacterium]MBV9553426.1 carbohydrate ABC transporter substrate-binding protein [Alphaproteobacteria bacterium]
MTRTLLTRRTVFAAAAGAALAAPFVRGAHAAGKLSVGFWDHWVPGANDTLTKLCHQWADKEKVDISIDYITSQADKLNLTQAAEAQAKSGHDMLTFLAWAAAAQTDNLEPLDDIMGPLTQANGKIAPGIEFVARQDGHWIAVPACVGSPTLPSAARIDLFKDVVNLDITKMYPAGGTPDKELTDKWTWDSFLQVSEKFSKAGRAMGVGFGVTNDSVAWTDAVMRAYGAAMVDKDGNITVKSDATKQVLEWFQKLVPFCPKDAFAWDDASNNKYLISGEGPLIFNPPSAWAVAVRDAPKVGEQIWHFPPPKGPKGRFEAAVPFFWGVWKFSQNKPAAKSLLTFLCQKDSVEQTVAASRGYDIPPFEGLHDYKTWAEEGPPKGGLYNYVPRGETEMVIPYSPAPARIANQIYAQATLPKMIAKCTTQGQTVAQAIDWAAGELEGFSRS